MERLATWKSLKFALFKKETKGKISIEPHSKKSEEPQDNEKLNSRPWAPCKAKNVIWYFKAAAGRSQSWNAISQEPKLYRVTCRSNGPGNKLWSMGNRKLGQISIKQKRALPEIKKESLCKNVQFLSVLKEKLILATKINILKLC